MPDSFRLTGMCTTRYFTGGERFFISSLIHNRGSNSRKELRHQMVQYKTHFPSWLRIKHCAAVSFSPTTAAFDILFARE